MAFGLLKVCATSAGGGVPDLVSFNRDIRLILSENCYYCHGSTCLAGGGVKTGCIYGNSDNFPNHAAEGPCHVLDLQATLMHLCGIHHERFTCESQGRDLRLTDVHGELVKGILA